MVLVWKLVLQEFPADEPEDGGDASGEPEAEEEEEDEGDAGEEGQQKPVVVLQPEIPINDVLESDQPSREGASQGEGCHTIQALMAELPTPDAIPPQPPAISDLEVDWVHGYNPFCGGRPVAYLSDGSICYPTGSTLIRFDKASHTQQLLRCDGRINVAAVSESEDVVVCCSAVDDSSRLPVVVWNALSRARLATLYCPPGSRGASAIALSPVSIHDAAVCNSSDEELSKQDPR